MPLSDFLEAMLEHNMVDLQQILFVLVKEGNLMIGLWPWADGIYNHIFALLSVKSIQLAPRLFAQIVKNTSTKIIKFTFIDEDRWS